MSSICQNGCAFIRVQIGFLEYKTVKAISVALTVYLFIFKFTRSA